MKMSTKVRRAKIIQLAKTHVTEGDLELDGDDSVLISEGKDNGAYVQMWKWVEFAGTSLCKDKADCVDCEKHG